MKRSILIMMVAMILSSCTKHKVVLPHGEVLTNKQISELEEQFHPVFLQYEGFRCTYSDSLLSSFVIYTGDKFGDVLSDEEIARLKQKEVTGVVFQIPHTLASFQQVLAQVRSSYKPDSVQQLTENSVVLWKDNEALCEVKYFPAGFSMVSIGEK